MAFVLKRVWIQGPRVALVTLTAKHFFKIQFHKNHHKWNSIFFLIIISLSKVIHLEAKHFSQTTKPVSPGTENYPWAAGRVSSLPSEMSHRLIAVSNFAGDAS